MDTHFCGTCGSARVSSEDSFRRNCGRAYSSGESTIAGAPIPQVSQSPRLDTALQPEVEPFSESPNSPTVIADPAKSVLSTRWLDFWVVLLYLGVAVSLISLTQAKTFDDAVGTILILLVFIPLRIYAATGLQRRKLTGWQANWIVMAAEWLFYPAARMTDGADTSKNAADYATYFLIYGLVWILPNAIYFNKRRTLFSGPPLVEGGVNGFFALIARLPRPPVRDQRWAAIAAREGMYAAAFVALDTAIFAVGSAFGYSAAINPNSLVDAAIFGAIAWGILKFSRVASVLGMLMQIVEIADKFANRGGLSAYG